MIWFVIYVVVAVAIVLYDRWASRSGTAAPIEVLVPLVVLWPVLLALALIVLPVVLTYTVVKRVIE